MSGGADKVAVVGAGLMGRGIGLEYALGGAAVALLASSRNSSLRAVELARDELGRLAAAGVVSRDHAERAAALLRAGRDLADTVAGATLVVESLPERLDLKHALLDQIEPLVGPGVPLVSNTSTLPITRIAERARHPERVLGAHYWNPPYLMPLVELISGERTDPAIIASMERRLAALGKLPVRVRRDEPGFLWNRLQAALLREAIWLVENGVASVKDVDLVVRYGLGRRYSALGLFEAVDLGGLATWQAVAELLFPVLSAAQSPGSFFDRLLAQGRRGAAQGGGVYDWPPERLEQTRARRDALLAEWLARDRQESSPESRASHS